LLSKREAIAALGRRSASGNESPSHRPCLGSHSGDDPGICGFANAKRHHQTRDEPGTRLATMDGSIIVAAFPFATTIVDVSHPELQQ